MDGMNQNNNNPYGQPDNTYQANEPYSQNNVQQSGNVYQQGGVQQQMGIPYQQNDPYHHNPYQPQNSFGTQPVQPYNPQKKGAGLKIVIGLVCALVVLGGIGVGVLAHYRSKPSYKINQGLLNLAKEIEQVKNPLSEKIGMDDIAVMMQEEGSHVETALDFTTEVPLMGSSAVTFGVDTDFYKDVHAKELNSETSISVLNYDFMHFNIYANDEVFCFSMPELFLENMYIENENVVSQYNSSFLNGILEGGTPNDAKDFSIDLFPDEDERISVSELRDFSAFMDGFEADINACREGMTIEKADADLYRVTFPARETDRLMKDFLESYGKVYGAEEELEMWKEYKTLVLSDVSFLFEIDSKNRIESITLEEPVEMMDGEASLEAEIFFMGETKSIDKIQGKLKAKGVDDIEREVLWQIQQTSDNEVYKADMDFKVNEAGETLGKLKFVMDCNAAKDTFDITCSYKDDESEMEIILESSIDDYVKGESIEIDLDKAVITMDGEELFKLSGDIDIEPLQGAIQPSVEPERAFFDMSYADWLEIIYLLEDEYGGILDYLW